MNHEYVHYCRLVHNPVLPVVWVENIHPALDKGFFSTLGGISTLAAGLTTILDRSA